MGGRQAGCENGRGGHISECEARIEPLGTATCSGDGDAGETAKKACAEW